jgi:hypothetical protein
MQGLISARRFSLGRSFTKSRRKIFDAAALEWLAGHARQVFAKMDCRLLASEGEADHHILVEYPPKLSVSVLVNAFQGHVKSDASRGTGQTSPLAIATMFCGRRPISRRRLAALIKQYVEQQRQRASSSPSYGRGFRALKIW